MDTIAPSSSATGAVRANNPGCAACKYQRRKCKPDCVLAPYFPADIPQRFVNVHKLFGVGNILRLIRWRNENVRNIMMSHLIYQADRRAADPVGGCYRQILQLQILKHKATARLAELRTIRDFLRAHAATGAQPISDGQNALPGPAFDGENVLPGPVFDGRNASPGAVFDDVPPQNQDLIEAILMDDGDEDQKPMNFSGVQEHQQPTPLSAAAPGGEWQDQASTSCKLADQEVISLQPTPLSPAAPKGEWQDQASTSCECTKM